MAYWLLKTEPSVYSLDQLKKDGKTHWNNVRNYQARNNLRQMKLGDSALIYHSNEDRAVVGIAEVVREAYPDIDPEGGDWSQVDVQYVRHFAQPVTLAEIKTTEALQDIPLIRQSRLSSMQISEGHFQLLCKMGGAT